MATRDELLAELSEVREKLKASGYDERSDKRSTQEQWDLRCRQATILDSLGRIRDAIFNQGAIA